MPTQLDRQHYIATTAGSYTGNYVLVAPLLCPEDKSEFDDDYDTSKTIGTADAIYYDGPGVAPRTKGLPFGQKIPRIFDVQQDQEWFNFEAEKDKSYVLEISDLAPGVKPLIIIYDTDGTTQVASGQERLEWVPTITENKTFFINVNAQLDSAVGCNAKLKFTLSEN